MSGSVSPSTFSPANVSGSPGSSMAGLAVMAPAVMDMVSSFHVPTNPAGWLQIGLGALALFFR